MYPCAKCDRKFLYREDCETHVAVCEIAQRRVFKPFRLVAAQPRLAQSTIVATTEIEQLRGQVVELQRQVAWLMRRERGFRAANHKLGADGVSNTPSVLFTEWLSGISVTQTHLQAVFTGELIDGLEAVFRDAVLPDSPICAHVMRTRTELRCFVQMEDCAQWRKMADADYNELIAAINRKLNEQFVKWRRESDAMQTSDETKINCAITCMSKIYNVNKRSATMRATEFRRRAQQILGERKIG
jgi:hypothetical protein